MWNPDIYRDTDYGLGEGETFEPLEDTEEQFEPGDSEPYVRTVLGPIATDDAGVTLVREHLQWAPPEDQQADTDNRLDDPNAALVDLEAFFTVSGRTIVSATPAAAGRDARRLIWLAQHAPVHIVAVTGFHHHGYLARQYAEDAPTRMRQDLERDLTDGMDGTTARPGLIHVGTSYNEITPLERLAIELAAEAHLRHRLPITTHAERGTQALEQLGLLASHGVAADRVLVGHLDMVQDAGYVRTVAETGAYLSFDQIGKPYADPPTKTARRIADLFAEGFGDQVLISHDFSRRSLLTGYGGRPGLPYIVEQFAVMLLEEGLEALDVRRILVDNAARAIAITHPESAARA